MIKRKGQTRDEIGKIVGADGSVVNNPNANARVIRGDISRTKTGRGSTHKPGHNRHNRADYYERLNADNQQVDEHQHGDNCQAAIEDYHSAITIGEWPLEERRNSRYQDCERDEIAYWICPRYTYGNSKGRAEIRMLQEEQRAPSAEVSPTDGHRGIFS